MVPISRSRLGHFLHPTNIMTTTDRIIGLLFEMEQLSYVHISDNSWDNWCNNILVTKFPLSTHLNYTLVLEDPVSIMLSITLILAHVTAVFTQTEEDADK